MEEFSELEEKAISAIRKMVKNEGGKMVLDYSYPINGLEDYKTKIKLSNAANKEYGEVIFYNGKIVVICDRFNPNFTKKIIEELYSKK